MRRSVRVEVDWSLAPVSSYLILGLLGPNRFRPLLAHVWT